MASLSPTWVRLCMTPCWTIYSHQINKTTLDDSLKSLVSALLLVMQLCFDTELEIMCPVFFKLTCLFGKFMYSFCKYLCLYSANPQVPIANSYAVV